MGGIQWTGAYGKTLGSIGIHTILNENESGDDFLRLRYTVKRPISDELEEFDYLINLVTTACNPTGYRYWFLCPLIRNDAPCGKRVAKLYLPPSGRYFGCRTCYDLTYKCQKEHDKRVDAVLKNPASLLPGLARGDFDSSTIALKAYFKLLGKS